MKRRFLPSTVLVSLILCALVAWCDEPPNGLSGIFGESKDASTVAPTTGAFGYVVPLTLPPNRGSLQPVLNLAYESGSKVGDAGVGWTLSIPSIDRTPLSGWPKYVDDGAAQNEDRFSYGGLPLTFICVVGGSPTCPLNDQVGPMPSWAAGYRHYRLQVEGSFERFFWRPANNRWIVQQRGGHLLEFGSPLTRPDLQPVDAWDTDTPSGKAFRWYLAVERDLHGARNAIIYQWAADGPSSRRYLRHIYYVPPDSAVGTSQVDAFSYHVELRWDSPPFRQSDFTFADKRPHYKRLRRVAISARPWSGGGDREFVRAYNLAYYVERGETVVIGEAPLWGRSALKSVQMEGRCNLPILETGGVLPDPTSCPTLPPITFEYSAAKLAFGAATYSPVGKPGTREELAFPTSSALIDVNRDGLPDLIQAWPTNLRRDGFTVEYHDCQAGDFIINPTDEQTNDPQLTCAPDKKSDDNVNLWPARIHRLWMNHGPSSGKVQLDLYCLDAGDLQPQSPTYYQVSSPSGYSARKPALFTQYGAEAVSEWGNGSMLWSLAGYHAFGFQPATIRKNGAPFQPDEYDAATFQHFCPESIEYSVSGRISMVQDG